MTVTMPNGWQKVEMQSVCDIGRGASPRPIRDPQNWGGRIPWVKIADATAAGKYIRKTQGTVTDTGASKSKFLPAGSLIVANSATVGFAKILGVDGCIHDGWLYLTSFRGATSDFLYYCINYYRPHLEQLASGVTQKNLNTTLLKNFEIALPPLSTQRKIASVLSAYDDLIENNARRIEVLKEMAQRIYQEWFVNFRFPGHERVEMVESETGPIPEGWEVKTFSELLKFTLGGDWGSEEPTDKNRCPVTIIRGTDFDDMYYGKALRVPTRYISESSLKKRKLFPGDTIVENSVNASSRSTGRSRLMTQHDLNQINGDSIAASFCKVFRPKDLGIATLIQLHLAYLYDENRMKFYQHVATNGIGNFQAKRFIESEAMSLPTNNESRSQMTGFLTDLLKLRSSIARRNQVLQHTRDLLLPKLVSGEIDVEALDFDVETSRVS